MGETDGGVPNSPPNQQSTPSQSLLGGMSTFNNEDLQKEDLEAPAQLHVSVISIDEEIQIGYELLDDDMPILEDTVLMDIEGVSSSREANAKQVT